MSGEEGSKNNFTLKFCSVLDPSLLDVRDSKR
jgi:hypothetical protein